MGASGGPYDAGTSPLNMGPIRHGSAEQNARVGIHTMGGYLSTMNDTGGTPLPSGRRTPRTPARARSQRNDFENDEFEDRRDRRREREDRRRDDDEPLGSGFRRNACETSLRDHETELAAQRVMVSQLADEMKRLIGERELHGQRLDAVFALVDQRFSESQKAVHETQTMANDKLNVLKASIDSVSQGLAALWNNFNWKFASYVEARHMHPPNLQRHFQQQCRALYLPPLHRNRLLFRHLEWDQTRPRHRCLRHSARLQPQCLHHGLEPPLPMATLSAAHRLRSRAHPRLFRLLDLVRPPDGQAPNVGAQAQTPTFGASGQAPAGSTMPPGAYAAGAGTQLRPFEPRDWNTDGKNISKELRVYDGDMAHYDTWRMRVRNHVVGTNCNYLRVCFD